MSEQNASPSFTRFTAEEAEFIRNVFANQNIPVTQPHAAEYCIRASSISAKCESIINQELAEKKLAEGQAPTASVAVEESEPEQPEQSVVANA